MNQGRHTGTFPTDEANREKTDKLQAVFKRQGHDFAVTPGSVPVDAAGNAGERTSGSGPKNNFSLAEFIAKIFGKEIVWVTVDGPSSFNGVVVPGGALSKQVFIIVNATRHRERPSRNRRKPLP